MTVIWAGRELPSFELDMEERAIVIGSLRLAAEKDSSKKLALMLKTFEAIDQALLVMATVEQLRSEGWSQEDFAAALKKELKR